MMNKENDALGGSHSVEQHITRPLVDMADPASTESLMASKAVANGNVAPTGDYLIFDNPFTQSTENQQLSTLGPDTTKSSSEAGVPVQAAGSDNFAGQNAGVDVVPDNAPTKPSAQSNESPESNIYQQNGDTQAPSLAGEPRETPIFPPQVTTQPDPDSLPSGTQVWTDMNQYGTTPDPRLSNSDAQWFSDEKNPPVNLPPGDSPGQTLPTYTQPDPFTWSDEITPITPAATFADQVLDNPNALSNFAATITDPGDAPAAAIAANQALLAAGLLDVDPYTGAMTGAMVVATDGQLTLKAVEPSGDTVLQTAQTPGGTQAPGETAATASGETTPAAPGDTTAAAPIDTPQVAPVDTQSGAATNTPSGPSLDTLPNFSPDSFTGNLSQGDNFMAGGGGDDMMASD